MGCEEKIFTEAGLEPEMDVEEELEPIISAMEPGAGVEAAAVLPSGRCRRYLVRARRYLILYRKTRKRKYLCLYYRYLGAYYCCLYRMTRRRAYLIRCRRCIALYKKCRG